MAERSFDDFDEYAQNYRAIHTENVKISGADSMYFAEHKVKMLAHHEQNELLQVLDVGCGDGATAYFMENFFSAWIVNGVDISELSIVKAKSRGLKNAAFGVYDGFNLQFSDNSIDVVFIAAVLHHVEFKLHKQLISEIYRVLKPGGRVYVFEHNPLNPATRYLVKTCIFDKDAKLLYHGYTKQLLKQSGFTRINTKFLLFFPRKWFVTFLEKLEPCLSWLPLGAQYYCRAVKPLIA